MLCIGLRRSACTALVCQNSDSDNAEALDEAHKFDWTSAVVKAPPRCTFLIQFISSCFNLMTINRQKGINTFLALQIAAHVIVMRGKRNSMHMSGAASNDMWTDGFGRLIRSADPKPRVLTA